jgi:hypothetical protein
VRIVPRMPSPNPYAVGAIVEVYAAGQLAQKSAGPIAIEKAHPDGTPVHVGLGDRAKCDVRIRFPGGKTIVRENIDVDREWILDLDSTGQRRPK